MNRRSQDGASSVANIQSYSMMRFYEIVLVGDRFVFGSREVFLRSKNKPPRHSLNPTAIRSAATQTSIQLHRQMLPVWYELSD
jgi:hypothetical protein